MGLDISFNREKAIAAGLKLSQMANGTEDSIAHAQTCEDTDYLEWLQREEEADPRADQPAGALHQVT